MTAELGSPVSLPRLTLSRDQHVSIHAQIEDWLSSLIESQILGVGDRLPNERQLSADLNVSRMTLRQALNSLEARGLVMRVPGRLGGAFVSRPAVDVDLTTLPGLAHETERGEVGRVIEAQREINFPENRRSTSSTAPGSVFERTVPLMPRSPRVNLPLTHPGLEPALRRIAADFRMDLIPRLALTGTGTGTGTGSLPAEP